MIFYHATADSPWQATFNPYLESAQRGVSLEAVRQTVTAALPPAAD
jgi:hypothetical protein